MSNQPKSNEKESELQLAQHKENCWYDKKNDRYIPFSDMSLKNLRRAKHLAQRMEIEAFKKAGTWGRITEKIDNEAERRGVDIKDLDTLYHTNKKKHVQVMQRLEQEDRENHERQTES